MAGILAKTLHAMGNSKPLLARHFLDLGVLLLSYGEVAAVMEMGAEWYVLPCIETGGITVLHPSG